MQKMVNRAETKTQHFWIVEIDGEKCSLCEMCAYRCPTKAIVSDKTAERLELVFDYTECDCCNGDAYCMAHCPEAAINISRVPASRRPLETAQVLISGIMAKCIGCGSIFTPEKKIIAVLKKPEVDEKLQKYCPDCRREELLKYYSGPLIEGK